MVSFLNNQFTENTDFANRSFKYGDGLFETMRLMRGELLFFNEHMERMMVGLSILRIELLQRQDIHYFYKAICDLLERNQLHTSAGIRIQVWRDGEGAYKPASNAASVLIEVKPVDEGEYRWNEAGLKIDLAKKVRKSYDAISNIKTSSALTYVMAAVEGKENDCDEMIVLNAYEKIADATSSNVFIIKDKQVITPSLRDAGVAGVFRHHLIGVLNHFNYPLTEQTLAKEDIMNADEIFLTNVIRGIQPVSICAGKKFNTGMTNEIFNLFNKQLLETTD